MNGTIAVTDYGWYEFLQKKKLPEVNFWKPSDRRQFHAPAFSPFFFKLKAPHNAICGFAYFAQWSSLPDWLAWECFGEGNGCRSLQELRDRLARIRKRIRYDSSRSINSIGCILLVQPAFFDPEDWIPQPADWRSRTVSGKSYDLTTGEGLRIWEQCQDRAAIAAITTADSRYGSAQTVHPRLGQGTFRVAVTDAYGRACSVTNEHSLPALEAAHLRAFASDGPNEIANGVLLRADLHRLYDNGYVTITQDLRLQVSPRLREDFSNGHSYYPLSNRTINLPNNPALHPDRDHLAWHHENVYLG
ncbi:MAG TPA: HNH endonuclease [Longimicrobiaceae bacterium]|nr:HNH endonuclease [Longimicrobiaceae bacterium]